MASITAGLAGRLTVDLAALRRNWLALDRVSGEALTGAVVKADGYGLGLEVVAAALQEAGARFFFVATPDEGLRLRHALPDAHVFVLDGLYPGAADLYGEARLMPVLSSVDMLEEWLGHCMAVGEALPAALHFDTGMNRLGFRINEAGIVRYMMDQPGFAPQLVMSHFACADQPAHEKTRTQLALFHSVLQQFPGVPASMSNSAGMMTGREHHFQMVRPGIALYGGRAVNGRRNPMHRVVSLDVPVLQVKEARTGETVGYGATQTLSRDSRLAIIALGYADGFLRALSSTNTRPGGKAAVRGRVVPVIGRVSMDLVALDVTELGSDLPVPGEMVEILGPHLSVDDQADAADTIGYEILTSLRGRYERVYADRRETEEDRRAEGPAQSGGAQDPEAGGEAAVGADGAVGPLAGDAPVPRFLRAASVAPAAGAAHEWSSTENDMAGQEPPNRAETAPEDSAGEDDPAAATYADPDADSDPGREDRDGSPTAGTDEDTTWASEQPAWADADGARSGPDRRD